MSQNDRMISVHFHVYAPTSNTEEGEVEEFYEDLQDLLELTPKKKKKCHFHYSGLESKSRKLRNTWSKTYKNF